MKPKMRDEDRRAMDVALNHNGLGRSGSTHAYAATDSHMRERVACVERVLHLLDMMPVSDPPANLVSLTLQRVEAMAQRDTAAARQAPAAIVGNHPPA